MTGGMVVATFTFTNSTGASIPPSSTVSHTAQNVTALGMQGLVTDISVKLTDLTHTYPTDLNFLLAGPNGHNNLVFFSDAGGAEDISGVDLTFQDTAADQLTGNPIVTGTYKPSNYDNGQADSPENPESFGYSGSGLDGAGPSGTGTFSSAFGGIAPNGTWTLYMADDYLQEDNGTLGGWSVSVQTSDDAALVKGTAATDTLKIESTSAHAGSFVFNGSDAVDYSGVSTFSFDGGAGNDTFVGGDEVDRVAGGKGDDILHGNKGADDLTGGKGADDFLGGKGADNLYAGKGDSRDVFIFDKGDSSKDHSDQIFGFDSHDKHEKVSDKIDLSSLGVKWDDVSLDDAGKNVTVSIDYKGPGKPDMVIEVMKVDELHKADFIL